MASALAGRYGPWAIIAGGSDGIGSAFAHALAARGMNVVLVARRKAVLEATADDIRATHGVEVATVSLDLTAPGALADLQRETAGLEPGLFVYNAGGDDYSAAFLDKELATHLQLVQRNCVSVLEAAYRFGGPMVARGRGALVLVTSGAAWPAAPPWPPTGQPRRSISCWRKACGRSGAAAGSTYLDWCSARPTPRPFTGHWTPTAPPTGTWPTRVMSPRKPSGTWPRGPPGSSAATTRPAAHPSAR